jgi:SAM-dependent methyltransferase
MRFDFGQRTTFNSVAELYDEVRPGYPQALIEDTLTLSEIPPDGRILEIGCGTGKATLPFARRGYAMLCLELGDELAAVAARNCLLYPRVEIQNVSFEDWSLQRASFDLVISAQAFHWIPHEIGFPKSAAALKDSGSIALFWNHYPPQETAIRGALDQVYREKAPQLARSPGKTDPEGLIARTVERIDTSGLFGDVAVRRYPWTAQYTSEQYTKLLNTYSDHLSLDEDTRRRLFNAISDRINEFGGTITRPYLAVLYLARKKPSS